MPCLHERCEGAGSSAWRRATRSQSGCFFHLGASLCPSSTKETYSSSAAAAGCCAQRVDCTRGARTKASVVCPRSKAWLAASAPRSRNRSHGHRTERCLRLAARPLGVAKRNDQGKKIAQEASASSGGGSSRSGDGHLATHSDALERAAWRACAPTLPRSCTAPI